MLNYTNLHHKHILVWNVLICLQMEFGIIRIYDEIDLQEYIFFYNGQKNGNT